MALRVLLNRTKPWGAWGCWGYRSIVGQNLLFNFNTCSLPVSFKHSCRQNLGTDANYQASLNHCWGLNHRLLPVPSNLACPPFRVSPPTPPLPVLSMAADDNNPFKFVSLAAMDNEGALSSAHFAVRKFNALENDQMALKRRVGGSVIWFGWSIYSLELEVTRNRKRSVYYAMVLHDPSLNKKKLIEWRKLGNLSHERRLGLNFEESSLRKFTVESHIIVPVDVKACKKSYKYALSAVYIHNYIEADKICLEELLCASKLEVDGEAFHFLLLRGEDACEEVNVYCAIMKVSLLKQELIRWYAIGELFSLFEKTS